MHSVLVADWLQNAGRHLLAGIFILITGQFKPEPNQGGIATLKGSQKLLG